MKRKQFWLTMKDFALILLGTAVQAVGLRLFLIPAKLVRAE